MSHKYICQNERYQIYALSKAGHHELEITQILGKRRSTISRQVQ